MHFAERIWPERVGLLIALIVAVSSSGGTLLGAGVGIGWILAAQAAIAASITVAWLWTRRPPRTKRDRIGFLVSIIAFDDKEGQKLREDFVLPLQRLIKSSKAGYGFHFLELPQFLAKNVVDIETAEAIRRKCRAHMMLYGSVRVRQINGEDHHVIELDGIVSHPASLDERVRGILGQEFGELLPRRVHVPATNDVFALQFTSE